MGLVIKATHTLGINKKKTSRYSKDFKWLDSKMKDRGWSIKDGKDLYKFPYWMLKKVYSAIDVVIYKGRNVRGRVVYLYIPEEWTVDGIPIIVDVVLDMGRELPEDAIIMSFRNLKDVFINNKFQD